jgi:hypothetical protein
MRCKTASLGREGAANREQMLALIGRGLREEYDTAQPLLDRPANLVRQIAQLTDDKNSGDDGEPTIVARPEYKMTIVKVS